MGQPAEQGTFFVQDPPEHPDPLRELERIFEV